MPPTVGTGPRGEGVVRSREVRGARALEFRRDVGPPASWIFFEREFSSPVTRTVDESTREPTDHGAD
eukprot:scaffold16296_cov127-Isochrysis_galbana.AAC.1